MHGDISDRPPLSAPNGVKSETSDKALITEGPKWKRSKSEATHVPMFPKRVSTSSVSPVPCASAKMKTMGYNPSKLSASESSIYPLQSSLFPSAVDRASVRMNRRKALYAEPRNQGSWESKVNTFSADNSSTEKCFVGGKGFSRFLRNQMRWRDMTADSSEQSMKEEEMERWPRGRHVSSLYSNHGLNISLVHKGSPRQRGSLLGQSSSVIDVIEQATRKYEEQVCGSPRRPQAVLAATRNTAAITPRHKPTYVPTYVPTFSQASAATTPSGPFSSSQELIGSYSSSITEPLRPDDLRIGGGGGGGNLTDRDVVRWKSSNHHQQRPPSHGKEHRHSKGSVEKDSPGEKRGQSPLLLNNGKLLNTSSSSSTNNNNTGPVGSINNQFKALGMRNNFLGGQQIPTSSSSGSSTAPPPPQPRHHNRSDELIAMGTNWNPPPSSNTNASSNVMRNGRGGGQQQQAASTSSNNLLMPVASRKSVSTRGPMLAPAKHKHDEMPRYSDPLPGAPPSFQQRLAELSSLEQETIRYEKNRKFKKKVKDSS